MQWFLVPFLRCTEAEKCRRKEEEGVDDEERLKSCQREIFRLRNVIRFLEEDERLYESRLREEAEKESAEQPGLKRAIEIWQEIQKES